MITHNHKANLEYEQEKVNDQLVSKILKEPLFGDNKFDEPLILVEGIFKNSHQKYD